MRRRLAIIVSTPRPGRGTGQAGCCQGQRVNVHGYTIGTAVAVSVADAIARRFGAPEIPENDRFWTSMNRPGRRKTWRR